VGASRQCGTPSDTVVSGRWKCSALTTQTAHTDEALLRMAMVVTGVLAVIEGRKPEGPVRPLA